MAHRYAHDSEGKNMAYCPFKPGANYAKVSLVGRCLCETIYNKNTSTLNNIKEEQINIK